MGPQLDSCGRHMIGDSSVFGGPPLQWGRNLTVAEGSLRRTRTSSPNLLQWGRNLTVAEGNVTSINHSEIDRFNGAAT